MFKLLCNFKLTDQGVADILSLRTKCFWFNIMSQQTLSLGAVAMEKSYTVLLVEDDPFTRHMMREISVTLGVDVEIAVDGQDGLDRLFSRPDKFGLILMDLQMPRASGIEAVQVIRAKRVPFSTIPIVALTADSAFHDMALISRLGMDGYASKPVSPGKLLQLIDQYCQAA